MENDSFPIGLIQRIEEKAEKWRGQSFKLYDDPEPMHPYSVLKMLANELRIEMGLPIVEEIRETAPGRWGWVKV